MSTSQHLNCPSSLTKKTLFTHHAHWLMLHFSYVWHSLHFSISYPTTFPNLFMQQVQLAFLGLFCLHSLTNSFLSIKQERAFFTSFPTSFNQGCRHLYTNSDMSTDPIAPNLVCTCDPFVLKYAYSLYSHFLSLIIFDFCWIYWTFDVHLRPDLARLKDKFCSFFKVNIWANFHAFRIYRGHETRLKPLNSTCNLDNDLEPAR